MIQRRSFRQEVFVQKQVEQGTGPLILASIPPVPATWQSS